MESQLCAHPMLGDWGGVSIFRAACHPLPRILKSSLAQEPPHLSQPCREPTALAQGNSNGGCLAVSTGDGPEEERPRTGAVDPVIRQGDPCDKVQRVWERGGDLGRLVEFIAHLFSNGLSHLLRTSPLPRTRAAPLFPTPGWAPAKRSERSPVLFPFLPQGAR